MSYAVTASTIRSGFNCLVNSAHQETCDMGEEFTSAPGFFGKLQSHGDFITRNLPSSFTSKWDDWLQESLNASKNQLADKWLEIYLTSPVWRFALSSNICGSESWAGVLMPSVDNVGRYFPLTIATMLPPVYTPIQIQEAGQHGWYERAEALALSTLADDFEFTNFENSLVDIGSPLTELLSEDCTLTVGVNSSNNAIHVTTSSADNLDRAYKQLANYALSTRYSTSSVWWTNGSEKVVPSLLTCNGLPPTSGLSAFLDGAWGRWGWREYPASEKHST